MGLKNLHFNKIPSDANTTGLWIAFSVAQSVAEVITVCSRGAQRTVPRPPESVSLANLREIQILKPQLRSPGSETLGVEPSHLGLNPPSRDAHTD